MDNKIARLELAAAHRGCAYYGLNEGVENHITMLAKVLDKYWTKPD